MADVFLSYARADAAAAERAATELERVGHSVWFDRHLPAHRPYSDVIATELEKAAAVLVLWSSDAARSEWVRSEANRARELHKLVQARLDDARLPMPFDQIQCADLSGSAAAQRAGWAQILSSVQALAGPLDEAPAGGVMPRKDRRGFIAAGAAAAGLVVAGTAVWRARSSDRPSPEAELLLQKGVDALQDNDVFSAEDPGSLGNAIALLTQATEADPRSSSAWGSLALAESALKRVSPPPQRGGLEARSRSAAAKALELDRREPRAISALLLLDPVYRHWSSAERADREALQRSAPIPLLFFLLSETLGSVGRMKEAAAVSIKADRKRFIIPGADRRVVLDLWGAGDLQGADQAIKLAVEHWPQHPQVWRTRVQYLTMTGRAGDALSVLNDESARPPGTDNELLTALSATAEALRGNAEPADAVNRNLAYLDKQPAAVFGAAQACAALGDLDTSLEILEGYYFQEGRWSKVAPAAGDQDRATSGLFLPPMKAAWTTPRCVRLFQRIGLETYWRRSGTVPDFRRSS